MATSDKPIGRRVRLLREGMNLSLRDLAERSGVSAQMLSQVERGETSPTIAVAERIAAGLELTLSQLLRLDEGDGVNVVRAGERRDGGVAAYGHRFEVLTPPLPGLRSEVSEHFLAPGAATFEPSVGTLWSAVASVRSARRTRRPARRRPSKACGEVTSCTRCRST